MTTKPTIVVTVVFCPAPAQCWEQTLTLAVGTTLGQALAITGFVDDENAENPAKNNPLSLNPEHNKSHFEPRLSAQVREALSFGIWGRVQPLGTVLAEGDRVEVYRALTIDPKDARRARFAQQGARGTGLFAKRRPGSKAGY